MTAKNDGTGQNDMWHYAVGSDRKGPVPRPTLAKLLASGEISAETYVWQPGMDNWVHLGDAPPLKPLVAGLEGDGLPEDFVEEDTQFTSAEDVKAIHGALDRDEEGLSQDTIVEHLPIMSSAASSGHTMVMGSRGPAGARATAPKVEAAKAAPAAKEDLFAAASSTSSATGSDIFSTATTSAQQPSHSDIFATSQPTAEDEAIAGVHGRRQSSVLFSLDELGREEGKKAPTGGNEAFVTDSSGLIDIKAVATSTKAPQGEDPFGSGAGLALPPRSMGPGAVAIPLTSGRKSLGPWILAAAVLIAGGVVAAVIATSGGDKAVPQQQVAQGSQTAPQEKPAAEKPAEPKPAEVAKVEPKPAEPKPAEVAKVEEPVANPQVGDKPADPTPADPTVKATEPPVEKTPAEKKAAEKLAAEKKAAAEKLAAEKKDDKPKVAEVAPASDTNKPKSSDENTSKVNKLLGQLNGDKTTDTTNNTPEEGTPPKLSAAVVRATIKNRFGSCSAMVTSGGPVSVTTSFVIAGSGVVQSARVVDAAGVGSDVVGCVVGVIKSTTFSKFTEPTMTVNLPVKLL